VLFPLRFGTDLRIPGGSSANRKLLVKHQPAKSVNPAAQRFGNSASPRPQIDCFSPAGRISPEKRASRHLDEKSALGQVAIRS
jgi:hypothetical protein